MYVQPSCLGLFLSLVLHLSRCRHGENDLGREETGMTAVVDPDLVLRGRRRLFFLSEKLQRPQNRAARTLMSASYDSNLDDLFRALGWRRPYYQRLEQKSILMYETLHGMTSDCLRSS